MGKGHKDRRREKRAQEMEEREKDERALKNELEEENEKVLAERELLKKQTVEPSVNEKSAETSDTDSGHGSSIATTTESPKASKPEPQDDSGEPTKRRSQIKGLVNIGNTCFFNVVIQVGSSESTRLLEWKPCRCFTSSRSLTPLYSRTRCIKRYASS